jgi:enamine deaminase RidA (YjgF/YER057c/UK114 family)
MKIVLADAALAAGLREQLGSCILRESRFGISPEPGSSESFSGRIAIPSFDGWSHEFWVADASVRQRSVGRIEEAITSDWALLRATTPVGRSELGAATRSIYGALFSHVHEHQLGQLVRMWNYIPRILDATGGLERYRLFNIGRQEAWADIGVSSVPVVPPFPAATGVGSQGESLVVECLVSRHPVVHLQNPRQKPAHLYSHRYGPVPPRFARATYCPATSEVFVSGTASLLGEESVWPDDARAQVRETFANLAALLDRRNFAGHGHSVGFGLSDLNGVRVYIRNASDYPVIRDEVEKTLKGRRVAYLRNDICRPDLLVEIEAVAHR